MRLRLRLLLLPCALLLLGLCGCNPKWEDFESIEGNFRCRMPGTVKTETMSRSFPGGTLTLKAAGVSRKDAAFMVGYADNPIPGRDFDYAAAIKAMAQTWRGEVLYQHSVAVDGIRGMEFEAKISYPGDGWAAGRIFVHKKRIYQLLALGENVRAESKEVREFWESFQLLKK
jgi:hypothetical protein